MENEKWKINSQLEKGFTLIEILITVVILGMLAAALLSLQYILSQNQILVWQSYLSVDEANADVTSLVREIRTAQAGENGSYHLEVAEDQELVFYSDSDFDGQVERLRYFLNGTQFIKGVIDPVGQPATYPSGNEAVKILTDNVRNAATPVFYYYNEDWPQDTVTNPLTTPATLSNVRLIRIFLRLNTNPDEADKDYLLESFSQIRTLKENL
ncbi:MAG: type II secretion system protein [Patescibacteria group bacterium]